MKTILIIDDCDEFRHIASLLLLEAGYDVFDVATPHEAFVLLSNECFDLIVCDLHMPLQEGEYGIHGVVSSEVGIRTIRELRNLFPALPIVAMSSTSFRDLRRIEGILNSVPAYPKPTDSEELLEIVSRTLRGEAHPFYH